MKTKIKTPSQESLETAFKLVAYSALKENGELVTSENIETEANRIERCVEYYYKRDKKIELDFPKFASKFLQENFKSLVFSDKYIGQYLDDVSDKVIERECYMEDVNLIF
jgi:hypothetical protein